MSELLNYLVENEPSFRKARLAALYSDFRSQRTLNPDGYQANAAAWRSALAAGVRAGLVPSRSPTPDTLVLTLDESLLWALESKQYGRPLALGAVVRDAIAERDLIALPHFLKSSESIYHVPSWADLPRTVAAWTMRQIGLGGGGGSDDKLPAGHQQFVVVQNVEAAARAFGERVISGERLTSRFERTFSKEQFRREFAGSLGKGPPLSEADLDVLLRFLARDKGLVLYDGRTVRVKAQGEDTLVALTAEDASIASLKELLQYLDHQTEILSKRVDELSAAAKEAVARKNRVAALAALRSKKLAESTLEKRFATRSQLQEVAAKIQQAADQVALVKVMDSSAEVLRSLNAQVGGVDKVEEVVDHLREQMNQVDEVGSILAEPGSGVILDEGEIDNELAVMEDEEKARAEEARRKVEEAQQERQAEETRKRLEKLEKLKPIQENETNVAEKEPQGVAEAREGIRKMSLEGPAPVIS